MLVLHVTFACPVPLPATSLLIYSDSVCNVVGAMDSLQGISVPDTAAGDLLASFRASEPQPAVEGAAAVERAQVALNTPQPAGNDAKNNDRGSNSNNNRGMDGFPEGEYPKFSMAAGDFVEVSNYWCTVFGTMV